MTTRQFWQNEAAKMRDTSAILDVNSILGNDEPSRNYRTNLTETVKLFGSYFTKLKEKAVEEQREYGCIITKVGKKFEVRNETAADYNSKDEVRIPRTYLEEITIGVFHVHYADLPIYSTTDDNKIIKYIENPISRGDAKALIDDLFKRNGYFNQIYPEGFFSLVLTNRGNYHAFIVKNKEKAIKFANSNDTSLNMSYEKAVKVGKNHIEALSSSFNPIGIVVIENFKK
jgi:hypothetical protein